MESTFSDLKIRTLLRLKRHDEAKKLYISNAFLSIRWLGEYQRMIWSKLSLKKKKQLFERFSISSSKKYTIETILKVYETPIVPLSFTIASINLAKKDISFLVTSNPYIEEDKEIISYDQDKWGIFRTTLPYYGIFENTKISKKEQQYLESLLISSISLSTKQKKEIIKVCPTLKTLQLKALIELLEKEKNKFHILYISDHNTINKLRKKTEKKWCSVQKYLHTLENNS